jgi:hypothetical protein
MLAGVLAVAETRLGSHRGFQAEVDDSGSPPRCRVNGHGEGRTRSFGWGLFAVAGGILVVIRDLHSVCGKLIGENCAVGGAVAILSVFV